MSRDLTKNFKSSSCFLNFLAKRSASVALLYKLIVDDTLLVIKPDNVKEVHNSLNKFDKNLRFTVDMFQNKVPHFLDLELSPDGISIF